MTATSAADRPSRPRPRIQVRRARLGDVGRLSRAYLGQSPASRQGYHPFRFHPVTVRATYAALVLAQTLLRGLMRRSPRFFALLLVAELEGSRTVVGSGTLRGVVLPGDEPRVRFGFFVAEGFQGLGVGKRILWALAAVGLSAGFRHGIGAVFQSDLKALQAIGGAGFRFTPTEYRDPARPDEVNYRSDADLAEMVRLARAWDQAHAADGVPPP